MVWSVVLFLIGAVIGVVVLQAILKNRPTPKAAVYAHGIFQVVAFIILLAAAAGAVTAPTTAIVLLAIAAVGGIVLFALDMSKKPIPRALAIVHPIIGVLGVIALIIFLAGGPGDAATGTGAADTTGYAAPGTGTGTSGMGTAPGNTGSEGMGGTTGTGTLGGSPGVTDTPRVPTGPDNGGRRR